MTNSGDFWCADTPERRQPGALTVGVGQHPELALEGAIVDSPCEVPRESARGSAVALSAVPERVVESFLPTTIHGQLDSGEHVTLLTARNHGGTGTFGTPRYVAATAVSGAWVSGIKQPYTGVRFQLNATQVLAHLQAGQTAPAGEDGTLRVEVDAAGTWLVYTCTQSATLRQLQTRAVGGVVVLTQLAIDTNETAARAVQVRIDGEGPWLPILNRSLSAAIDDIDADPLLRYEELTLPRLANWIATNDNLDTLAWPVAKPSQTPLPEQVIVSTSLMEGLHRRLPFQQTKFLGATKPAIKRVRDAAVEAAAAQAAQEENLDPELVAALTTSALGPLGDVSFQDRAAAVVAEVSSAIPEITETLPDIAERIKKARNDFAHHLLYTEAKEPLEERELRWMIVAVSTPWLLRALLLLRAGIEPGTLHTAFVESERFTLHLAEVARMKAELDGLV